MQPTNVEFSVLGHTQAMSLPENCEPEAVEIKTRQEWERFCLDQGVKEKKVNFKKKKMIKVASPTPSPHFVLGVVSVKKIGKLTLLLQYAPIVRDPQARDKMVPAYSSVFITVSNKEKFNRIVLDCFENFKPEAHFGELQTMYDFANDAESRSAQMDSLMFDLFAHQDPSFARIEEYERTVELAEDEQKNWALQKAHEQNIETLQSFERSSTYYIETYKLCVKRLCGKNIKASSQQG